MKIRLINIIFICIGLAIGVIFSLQIQASPPIFGTSPASQAQTRHDLLAAFSLEQEGLTKRLTELEQKQEEAREIMERRSSRKTLQELAALKELTSENELSGAGVRITLSDNPAVLRTGFSAVNENFVQGADIRDLINALFLKDAAAISLNGKRISPLTPIQGAFDSILAANVQITPPFVIEALGNVVALQEAAKVLEKRKIQKYVEVIESIAIPPLRPGGPPKFLFTVMP